MLDILLVVFFSCKGSNFCSGMSYLPSVARVEVPQKWRRNPVMTSVGDALP